MSLFWKIILTYAIISIFTKGAKLFGITRFIRFIIEWISDEIKDAYKRFFWRRSKRRRELQEINRLRNVVIFLQEQHLMYQSKLLNQEPLKLADREFARILELTYMKYQNQLVAKQIMFNIQY